ncbi:MAG: hypothetical protein WCJ56_05815 [bacterium]
MATQTVCKNCGASFISDETELTHSDQCPSCRQRMAPPPSDPQPSSQPKPPSFTLLGIDLQPGWKSFIIIQVVTLMVCMGFYLITGALTTGSNGEPVLSFFSYVLFGLSLIISFWYVVLGLYVLFAKPSMLPEWMDGIAETFKNSRESLRERDGYFVKYYGRPMMFLLDGVMQITSRITDKFTRTSIRIILVQIAFPLGLILWVVVAQISIMLAVLFVIIWIWVNHNNSSSSTSSGRDRRIESGPPGHIPGGTSKAERNVFTGEETVVHRDQQGNKTGTTKIETGFFTGEKVQVHKDIDGNDIGRTKNERGFFTGENVQVHMDMEGNTTGTTRQDTEFFTGEKVDVDRDNDGNVTGKSTDEKEFLTGEKYKQHRNP